MKKTIIIYAILFSTCAFSQVAIGKAGVTNSSVSLEFGEYVVGQGKGIIVPWVTDVSSVAIPEKGTIVFDTNDKIMKYRKSDGSWFNLSKNETTTVDGNQNYDTTGQVNTTLQDELNDIPEAKVSIGMVSSSSGVLVLEDATKAMILPKVPSPHLNIVNPEPGTMAYDTTTKQLAIFNGKVWSFWKP